MLQYQNSDGDVEWHDHLSPSIKPIVGKSGVRPLAEIPVLDHVYGVHYIAGTVTATIAESGVGKSTLAIAEAIAIATGKPLLGVPVRFPGNVWYLNLEDGKEVIETRIAAACQHYGIEPSALEGRLLWTAGVNTGDDLTIARYGAHGNVEVNTELVYRIRHTLKAGLPEGIDVLSIDPFVYSHAVSENDNTAIAAVVSAFGHIAAGHPIAVHLWHHVRKALQGGTTEKNADDARGASSLKAGVRAVRVLNPMTEAEARQAGIEDHRPYFRAEDGKANYTARSEPPRWFRTISVQGECKVSVRFDDEPIPVHDVGVVVAWKNPGPFGGVTEAHMHAVRRMAGEGDYRTSTQSPD